MDRPALKPGFTMIEVSLFLALTGLILIGLLGGVSSSISTQRFSDSAQETLEFIRSAYSTTINPINTSATAANDLSCYHSATSSAAIHQGQSTCALYGTLLVFGENNSTTIKTYQIVGDADVSSDISTLTDENSDNLLNLQKINTPTEEYTPVWEATIQNTSNNDLYQGQVLIIRLPSGVIQTYFLNDTTDFVVDEFKNDDDLDLCLYSPDASDNQRYDIRIAKNGSNSSAVQIVSLNSEDNKCIK